MKKLLLSLFGVFVIVTALVAASVAMAGGKVTICHASGLAGTTKFETLSISENAVYGRNGNAGHFEENGTPRAGHEQDTFGPCPGDENPPPTDDEFAASATCDTAKQQYVVSGTVNDDAASVNPATIAGNFAGDTEVTVSLDEAEGKVTVTTDGKCVIETPPPPPPHDCVYTGAGKDGQEGNDDCAVIETPTTPETPVVTTPAPPVTAPVTPVAPVTPKPVVKPKPKPKAVAKPKAKPKLKAKPVAKPKPQAPKTKPNKAPQKAPYTL